MPRAHGKIRAILFKVLLASALTCALSLLAHPLNISASLFTGETAKAEGLPLNASGLKKSSVFGQEIQTHLKRYDAISLDTAEINRRVRATGRLSLNLPDRRFDIALTPNDMRAPGYLAEEAVAASITRRVDMGEVHTFKGNVDGVAGSEARFTIDDESLEGLIITRDGKYFIESARKFSKAAGPSDFVVYTSADVIEDSDAACGATLAERVNQEVERVETQASAVALTPPPAQADAVFSPTKIVEVATEADYEYVTALGGSVNANNEILSIMNQVDGIYKTELGISFTITYQHTWATVDDPYVTLLGEHVLSEFQDIWNRNFNARPRDLAHLWTGRAVSNFNGAAIQSVLCISLPTTGPNLTYGWSKKVATAALKTALTAHEIGHNLGAHHTDEQTPPATACNNTIMQSALSGSTSTTFCQFSRDEIVFYLTSNKHDVCMSAFSIDGRVVDSNGQGIAFPTITWSGTQSGSINGDGQGNYKIDGLVPGGSYNITAQKQSYKFEPTVMTVSNLTSSVGGVNFKGTFISLNVSGRVVDVDGKGIADAFVIASGSDVLFAMTSTDANGFYTVPINGNSNPTVTPVKPGYNFNPPFVNFTNFNSNQTLNFVGTPSIYGRITDSKGEGVRTVTVTLSNSQTGATLTNVLVDANGYYTFPALSPGNYTVTPTRNAYTFSPASQSVNYSGGLVRLDFAATPVEISVASTRITVNESGASGVASLIVNRTGDLSKTSTMEYAAYDLNPSQTPCQSNTSGYASNRCDYGTAAGILRFLPGEASKTILVPIINDSYVEGSEDFFIALYNAQNALPGSHTFTIVTIVDDDTQPAVTNPIDNQAFFIRQQYIDFLGRTPEPTGFNFWMNRMNNCPQGQVCDRIDTSKRFFESDEFRERGFYVYRLFDAVLGRLPNYAEFIPDVSRLNGLQTLAEQRAAKDAYLLDFMNKTGFKSTYDQYLTSDHLRPKDAARAAAFVDALCRTAGITPANKQTLIANLQRATTDPLYRDPAHTLEDFILAPEISNVGTKFYDRSFIVMQYFGYLRRDPEPAGFDFWVGQLMGPNAPHRGDYRFMVGGFLNSDEYHFRFAQIPARP